MKTLLVLLALVSSPVFAASNVEVTAARVVGGKTLEVDVRFGGGCKKHEFKLVMGDACAESYPVQCSAEIKDLTKGDFCEAIVGQTAKFDLAQEGLLDSYFNGARISIDDGRGGSVDVKLPFKR